MDNPFATVALIIAFQSLSVLPHELGHALAGRWVGLKQIRILIGTGKPLFSLNILGFPALFLFHKPASDLLVAERMIRQAIELSPEQPTLFGTLGGIVVELGRFAEGETHLRFCLKHSKSIRDSGICNLYLGLIRLQQGEQNAARKLLEFAKIQVADPWLQAKADTALRQL